MKLTKSPNQTAVRRTPEQIEHLVQKYRQSGLTQGQYAAQLGVALSTLARWLRGLRRDRLDHKTPKTKFVEVDVSAASPVAAHGVYQIELPSGVRLRAEGAWRAEQVSQLLSILQRS